MTGLGECCLLANVYRTQVWAQFIGCLECEKPGWSMVRNGLSPSLGVAHGFNNLVNVFRNVRYLQFERQ